MPLAAVDRGTAPEPAFGVPLAQIWPSPHAAEAVEVTRRAVEALGIEDGPSFTQLRISRGGPEVIEVAARLGGSHDAELVGLVTGLDLNGLALAAAFGEPLARTSSPGRSGPGRRRGDPLPRRSARAAGVGRAAAGPDGMVAARVYHQPGHASARSAAPPTGQAPCSRPARAARRRLHGPMLRPSAYAS